LFLIAAIIEFIKGNVLLGLAFAGAAGVALHLAWPLSVPGRA
jgi:hypothetical protein